MGDNSAATLDRFRGAAVAFIEAVDLAQKLDRDKFVEILTVATAELVSSALYLPAVEPDTANASESPSNAEGWTGLSNALRQKLGPLDTYWEVFDSTAKSEPYAASLAGDVSEIYFDLKENLRKEGTGISHQDLLWDFRESFQHHWGRHATSVLKAMYDLHLA
jgi:hypothetical protein